MKKETEDPDLELAKVTLKHRLLTGERAYHLDLFGDALAKREGYKVHTGLDALHYYLIQKYHWMPAQVRALNIEDLLFLFEEEMHRWTIPAKFRSLKG